MSKIASLQPQLEFEIVKHVIVREQYIQRLKVTLQEKRGKIDIAVIGLIDVLRMSSIETIGTTRNSRKDR